MRTCCPWETFEDGFLAIWDRAGMQRGESHEERRRPPAPPRLLVDWRLAERHWRFYAMTGGEAARMQLLVLSDEALYLRRGWSPGPGSDDGGGGPGEPSPKAPMPLLIRA